MIESAHVTTTAHITTTRSIEAAVEPSELTIGVDLGDRHTDLCAIDRGGEILAKSRLPSTRRAFRQRFAGMRLARIAIEASRTRPPGRRRQPAQAAGHLQEQPQ
jgi:hypothetical protein